MLKRTLSLVLFVALTFSLTACFGPKAKEFSGSGITIELTEEFNVQETVLAPLYLVSVKHIFTGMREAKSELSGYGISNLSQYIQAVLTNNNKTGTIYDDTFDDITFKYAYYNATVDGTEYGYMLIVMEGSNHFYSMNFGCLAKDLDNNKDIYLEWAKTITVE